jgi:GTPase
MPRQYISTEKRPDRAVLIGVLTPDISHETFQEYLDELTFLLDTAGGEVMKTFIQKMDRRDSRYFVGSGKIQEIADFIEEHQPEMSIFDDELSPSQIRNLEKILNCRVMDRTNLILDIFARRARTAHAKTQVELAQYQYMLPRLTRMWTHLEKQRGGIGLRGPGEKEIETDRRIIRDRIALLKEKLKDIDKQKVTQRKSRESLVRVSLVGYTNVGKSTIMNLISKSDVFAEDKLFATLDTTVRKVVIGNLPFLLTDTVGFIRKLPHGLIESFKSTLDEVRESDIIVHVVDISHPAYLEHMETVANTLKEIGAGDKKTIMIFNKLDAYKDDVDPDDLSENRKPSLDELKNHWLTGEKHPCLFISAKEKTNLDEFRKLLYREVVKIHTTRYPFDDFLY